MTCTVDGQALAVAVAMAAQPSEMRVSGFNPSPASSRINLRKASMVAMSSYEMRPRATMIVRPFPSFTAALMSFMLHGVFFTHSEGHVHNKTAPESFQIF